MRFLFFFIISFMSHAWFLTKVPSKVVKSKLFFPLKKNESSIDKVIKLKVIYEVGKATTSKEPPKINKTGNSSSIKNAILKDGFTSEYPKMAKRYGYEGEVFFKVLVSVNGNVEKIELLKSSGHSILDSQAKKDLSSAKFIPAHMSNGKKIPDWIKISIKYSI